MKRLTIALGLLAALSVVGAGGAYRIVIPEQYPREIERLTKELHRVKLGQIAILIDDYSDGESKLLVGKSASAAPQVGMVSRGLDWGDIPFIAVHQVSRPVDVKLEDIGQCRLLGAVTTLVEATATGGDDKYDHVVAAPDVYLLAYGINDGWLEEVRLLAVSVDENGRRNLRVVLRTLARRHQPRLISSSMLERDAIPAAVVTFPGADEVSEDNPATRAQTTLAWEKESYVFSLDLRITIE